MFKFNNTSFHHDPLKKYSERPKDLYNHCYILGRLRWPIIFRPSLDHRFYFCVLALSRSPLEETWLFSRPYILLRKGPSWGLYNSINNVVIYFSQWWAVTQISTNKIIYCSNMKVQIWHTGHNNITNKGNVLELKPFTIFFAVLLLHKIV